jgi:hypothetical protein
MISTGGLIECPVTVKDLQRARAIYGPSVAAVRGKSKRQQSDKVAEPVKVDRLGPIDVSIWVDILFMNGMPALISVSGAMRFLQVTWLKGKDYPHVKKHLLLHVNKLRREGFRVTGYMLTGRERLPRQRWTYRRDAFSMLGLKDNT